VTATYDDYRRALTRWRDLPAGVAVDLDQARLTHDRAGVLADDAITAADAAASKTLRALEAQLAAARLALEPLGKSNLIPPRIRPSGGVRAATGDDVLRAQQALAAAVNQVRHVAQAEIGRMEAESGWQAREAADRRRSAEEAADRAAAAAVRRKRLIQVGVAAALVLAVLIVIVAVSL